MTRFVMADSPSARLRRFWVEAALSEPLSSSITQGSVIPFAELSFVLLKAIAKKGSQGIGISDCKRCVESIAGQFIGDGFRDSVYGAKDVFGFLCVTNLQPEILFKGYNKL